MSKKRPLFYRLQNGIFYSLAIVVFVAFFIITVWGKDGLIDLMALKQKRAQIVAVNYQLLKQNLIHTEEIQKLKKGRFVEQRARSDLGMIRDDEIVFVIK